MSNAPDAPPPAQSAANPPSPLATPLAWDLVADDYTAELVPQFERFASDALRLGGTKPDSRILDVATGPGSLALLAARTAASVAALDFSETMIARLRDRAAAACVTNVEPRLGDGQALPYDDESFDAAFSMFGLIFFPDRVRGLSEMRRCLVPGGRAVVASWKPFDDVPIMKLLFAMLREVLPHLPFGQGKAPLGSVDEFQTEFAAAGFAAVDVHPVSHGTDASSTADLWASFQRTLAPLVLLQRKMGAAAWAPVREQMGKRLEEELGAGPQRMDLHAWLGVASR